MHFIITSRERRAEAANYVSRLPGTPTMIVEIKPYKKSRSQAQNRLMWMWYGIIAKEVGCEPEDLHEQMKVRVLGVEHRVINGQALSMPKSSTGLTTDEMTKFLEAIEVLAASLSISLPKPQDYSYALGYDNGDI
ncbi:MAG: recombination protein NinB [Aeromonas sp.]